MAIGPFENRVAWHLNESDPPAVSGNEISQSAYNGSMQQILRENVGNYVICEFLVGTQNLERKEGILHSVGVSFLVLYGVYNQEYIVCDFYSLKFVTFLDPETLARRGINLSMIPQLQQ